MAESFVKNLKDNWTLATGAEVGGSDLGIILGAENNAGREMKFQGVTLDRRINDMDVRLEMLKNPTEFLQKRIYKEKEIKNKIQELFLLKKVKYLSKPYLMSAKDAEDRAVKAVQELFNHEVEDLNTEFGDPSTAENIVKHRNDFDV